MYVQASPWEHEFDSTVIKASKIYCCRLPAGSGRLNPIVQDLLPD